MATPVSSMADARDFTVREAERLVLVADAQSEVDPPVGEQIRPAAFGGDRRLGVAEADALPVALEAELRLLAIGENRDERVREVLDGVRGARQSLGRDRPVVGALGEHRRVPSGVVAGSRHGCQTNV